MPAPDKLIDIEGETFVYISLHDLSRLRYKAYEYDKQHQNAQVKKFADVDHKGWQALAQANATVDAIKLCRSLCGTSLKGAKDIVYHWKLTKELKYFD